MLDLDSERDAAGASFYIRIFPHNSDCIIVILDERAGCRLAGAGKERDLIGNQ